ncbi:polyketide cyclase [Planktosalinus lacus]|uniref:Polyketide cyclase n=2 Tax=Planktosalinus lacus TaxID=1526573 RepID=A0A8J2VAG7_9FLAO|nr:polyketide cyclase [Planktosalinus lacus]
MSIAPKNYHVNRSVIIQRPLSEVFEYIKYIKNQDNWSPWGKKDPDMEKTFTGTDGTVGFISHWKGNKQVGEGEQEITGVFKNERLETKLRFLKPWKSESDAYIKVEEVTPETTKVIWGFSGVNKPPGNLFMVFFNMDKTVGKDFEEGLLNLKQQLEK